MIYTRSLNCAAYIIYNVDQSLDLFWDREKNIFVFRFQPTELNSMAYKEYKDAVHNNIENKLIVDLVKYNNIIYRIKLRCKEYKRGYWTEAIKACSKFAEKADLTENDVREALERVRNNNRMNYGF